MGEPWLTGWVTGKRLIEAQAAVAQALKAGSNGGEVKSPHHTRCSRCRAASCHRKYSTLNCVEHLSKGISKEGEFPKPRR